MKKPSYQLYSSSLKSWDMTETQTWQWQPPNHLMHSALGWNETDSSGEQPVSLSLQDGKSHHLWLLHVWQCWAKPACVVSWDVPSHLSWIISSIGAKCAQLSSKCTGWHLQIAATTWCTPFSPSNKRALRYSTNPNTNPERERERDRARERFLTVPVCSAFSSFN